MTTCFACCASSQVLVGLSLPAGTRERLLSPLPPGPYCVPLTYYPPYLSIYPSAAILGRLQRFQLMALARKGLEVFGHSLAFRQWLRKPSYGLDGRIPQELLQTYRGIDLVREEIVNIAWGDMA